MTQRQYRRLTRFLFLLLGTFFTLLYLLMGRGSTGSVPPGGPQWRDRRLELAEVRVSEARSGGFLVSSFPIPASTNPERVDFEKNLLRCSTTIYNEGTRTVDVTPSIYGTRTVDETETNAGLHCGFYSYEAEDPVPLSAVSGWAISPHRGSALTLHTQEPGPIRLAPGERRTLVLLFWADLPALTDAVRNGYGVTVKLTSRAI